jgi:peptide/nickel transport system permease protein
MASTTAPDNLVNLAEPERRADSIWRMTLKRFVRHRMAVFGLTLLLAIVLFVTVGALFLSEEYANDTDIMNKYAPPSAEHPFGTDQVGRDILARCIYGGQISLVIGVFSVSISVTLGTIVGLAAGYFGGVVDAALMRIVEAMLAIPTLVLLLLLSRSLSGNTTIITLLGRRLSITAVAIVIIIGLTGWMGLARVVRSMVLTLKE